MKKNPKIKSGKYTPQDIMVYPIDEKLIIKESSLHYNLPVRETYEPSGKWGVVFTPKMALINNEAIGQMSPSIISISLYSCRREPLGGGSFGAMPCAKFISSFKDIRKYLELPITLPEFMGDRFNRNSRLQDNVRRWMEHFNS